MRLTVPLSVDPESGFVKFTTGAVVSGVVPVPEFGGVREISSRVSDPILERASQTVIEIVPLGGVMAAVRVRGVVVLLVGMARIYWYW
jgi:hypothetical protein